MARFPFHLPRQWHKTAVNLLYIAGFIPAIWTFYLGATNNLGADPVKTFEQSLGVWALRFLILTLAISPIRDLVGWNYLRYRRALGLLTFFYAFMHFTAYLVLDLVLNMPELFNDVLKRPFIMFGMAGLILLIPLALTSNNLSIRKLGKKWIWLHKLTYVVIILTAVHFVMSTKVLAPSHYTYLTIIFLLISYRLWKPINSRLNTKRK
ncbi:protein-methionine-sulfoxide reductase heme-binding subunit MsrQ [Brucellaceae bacterium C25G]